MRLSLVQNYKRKTPILIKKQEKSVFRHIQQRKKLKNMKKHAAPSVYTQKNGAVFVYIAHIIFCTSIKVLCFSYCIMNRFMV